MPSPPEVAFVPYQWENYTLKQTSDEIIAWGFNKAGENVLLRIQGFRPYCYVSLPTTDKYKGWLWNKMTAQPVIKAIDRKIKLKNKNCRPVSAKVCKRNFLYYYSEKPSPMLKLSFKKFYGRKLLQQQIENGVTFFKGRKTKTRHSFTPIIGDLMISEYNQLLIENNATSTQWLNLIDYEIPSSDERISWPENTKHEYIIRYKPSEPGFLPIADEVSDDFPYHPLVAAFDIETRTDNYKRMPVKYWDEHCIFMISIDSKKIGTSDKVVRKVFLYGDSHDLSMDKLDEQARKLLGDDACDVELIRAPSEKIMLELYLDYLVQLNPDILTGYNIHAYDYPYLEERFKKYGIALPALCSRLKNIPAKYRPWSWGSSAHRKVVLDQIEFPGRFNLDLYSVIYKDFKNRLPKYNLDTVLRTLLGKSKYSPVGYEDLFKSFDLQDRPRRLMNKCVKKWVRKKDLTKQQVKEFKEKYDDFSSCYGLIPIFHDNVAEKVIHTIIEMWEEGKENMLEAVVYSDYDSLGCIELFEFLSSHVVTKELAGICRMNCRDIYSRGEQAKGVSLLARKCYLEGYILYTNLDHVHLKFKGGHVGEMTVGMTKDVTTLDFNSLYPNEMITNNLCYTTLIRDKDKHLFNPDDPNDVLIIENEQEEEEEDENGNKIMVTKKYEFWWSQRQVGLLPELEKELIAARKKMKKKMYEFKGTPKEVVYDARQLGLKISCNSLYGMTGVGEKGMIPCKPVAMCTAGKGREHILYANKLIEDLGGTVVYNDTDSTMYTLPGVHGADCIRKAKEMEKYISDMMPGTLYFEYEKAGIFFGYTKKRYIIWKYIDDPKDPRFGELYEMDHKDAFIIRGILLARKDNCALQRNLFQEILFGILKEDSYQESIDKVYSVFVDMIKGHIPWNHLLIIKGVGTNYKSDTAMMKVFSDKCNEEGHPLSPGDKTDFIVEHVPGETKVGRKACLPKVYAKKIEDGLNPSPDVLYYINNTLKPSIEQTIQIGHNTFIKKERDEQIENACDEILYTLRCEFGADFVQQYEEEIQDQLEPDEYPTATMIFNRIRDDYLMRTKEEKEAMKSDPKFKRVHRLNIDHFTSPKIINTLPNETPLKQFIKAYKYDLKKENEQYDVLCNFLLQTCSPQIAEQLVGVLRGEQGQWEVDLDDDEEVGELEK